MFWGDEEKQTDNLQMFYDSSPKYEVAFKSFLKLSFWHLILNILEISSIYEFGSHKQSKSEQIYRGALFPSTSCLYYS